ncbi:MAG: tetratricopeptide repeat protein, partial [Desulfomonilaceae bacterium]
MGRPREAIPWMQKAVDAEPGNPKSWYNLAGMYALAGSPDMAIQSLNRAIDLGYSNYRNAASDPIFESVKNDPRFRKVLDRIHP